MKLEILPNYPLINTYAPSLYVLYYINDEINNNANYLFRLGYKQTAKIGFCFRNQIVNVLFYCLGTPTIT